MDVEYESFVVGGIVGEAWGDVVGGQVGGVTLDG